MLSEWESSLGLPDDCAIGESGGVSDRQRAVVAKLISTGGLNRDYYIRVAAALGYTITITQFRPAMSGMSVCGDALNGDEWPFTADKCATSNDQVFACWRVLLRRSARIVGQ